MPNWDNASKEWVKAKSKTKSRTNAPSFIMPYPTPDLLSEPSDQDSQYPHSHSEVGVGSCVHFHGVWMCRVRLHREDRGEDDEAEDDVDESNCVQDERSSRHFPFFVGHPNPEHWHDGVTVHEHQCWRNGEDTMLVKRITGWRDDVMVSLVKFYMCQHLIEEKRIYDRQIIAIANHHLTLVF